MLKWNGANVSRESNSLAHNTGHVILSGAQHWPARLHQKLAKMNIVNIDVAA